MSRPLILVSNDDGVLAPGIRYLWEALEPFADLFVVAPATEQSATGMSITIRQPLRLETVCWSNPSAKVWSVNGTPADCVKLALHLVLPRKPDLIVSGINRGSNAGRNLLYSGTVAAVIEGVLRNIPGIAFSVTEFASPCFRAAAGYAPLLVEYLLHYPLPSHTFLNTNFPSLAHGPVQGIRLTRQSKEYYSDRPEQRHHPAEGSPYYWLGFQTQKFIEEEDSEVTWLERGYATVVPVHVGELTDLPHLEKSKEKFSQLFSDRYRPV